MDYPGEPEPKRPPMSQAKGNKTGAQSRCSCEDGSRDDSDVARSQGMAGATRNRRKQERDSYLESLEGPRPCNVLILVFWSLTPWVESVNLNYHICGTLLQQPSEINTRTLQKKRNRNRNSDDVHCHTWEATPSV